VKEYKFEDIFVGLRESFDVVVTQEMMDSFRMITGDTNPLHNSEGFAKEKGFPSRIGYGMLTASFLSTLAGVYLPGKNSLIHAVNVEFPKPVFVGDRLSICGVVSEKNELFRSFTMKVTVRNSAGQKVCRGKMQMGVWE